MDTTVITMRAETAEANIAAYLTFAGPDALASDLGTEASGRIPVRRWRVETRVWRRWTREVSGNSRCSCGVVSTAAGLASHRKASGHV